MTDFTAVEKNLKARGYEVRQFATGAEAAAYLDAAMDGVTVGIGGSATVRELGLYELLARHNTVTWHWEQPAEEARRSAMTTEVYLTSVNALAETGELVNIDGTGNRVASTLFGHRKIYFLIGRNKLAADYDSAVWRARNVAAPQRARQLQAKTPCAERADRCYDCKSSGRICRGMVTLWGPMAGMEAEVLLINQELGL